MGRRWRIIYVDMAPSVGGSVISLYQLVKGLDRGRYEPYVIMREGHEFIPRFQDLGAVVMTTKTGFTGAMAGSSQSWQGARQSRLAGWLKRHPAGESLVHLVGFYLRTWPELRTEASSLRALMDQVQPDLVHLNDVVAVARAGIMATRGLRAPVICHLRAMDSRTHFDRHLSHSLRGYICISAAVNRHLLGLGGRIEPSWVVYNGLDLAEFEGLPDRQDTRVALGFAPDDRVVGCVGRLRPWKGQHILLHALAMLQRDHPRLRGLIVGSPERHEHAYEDELRALARGLGLEDRVVFTGFRRDVPALIQAMDLLVHASVSPEPFGRVIIEGMAAGTPVIGTQAGAVSEIIEDGVSGLLVAPDDPDSMARGIAYVCEHPQQMESWRLRAREIVERRFDAAQYVRGVERVYEAILQ